MTRASRFCGSKGVSWRVQLLNPDADDACASSIDSEGNQSASCQFGDLPVTTMENGKQIVISADRAPGEIKDLEERIKSRLSCGLIVDLHPTDYELRLGILQAKTEAFRLQYPGLEIAPEVLEFLARRITSNVRVLEGAMLQQ